jgi:hypothetical protein
MLPLLFLAGAAIVGIGLIAAFWGEIKSWLIRAAEYVAKVIKGIVDGTKVFFKKIGDMIKQISKNYSKNRVNNTWQETIVTRQVSEDEVPEEIRNKVNSSEKDFTKELELQLA